ncbi:hypothetical protein [Ochrobactrum sp. 3-3]|uniref:hypothetical protein n=1 Tax=Ochrobactrum sp. 3-3 TaxID=1830124 RepID=UPI002570B550|nr:hypothetical protein [Ochrobactrum sp. 3-3]
MTVAIVENRTLVVSVGTFAASIAAKAIEHQFDALTHFPDRRANIELDELAARLNDFAVFVAVLSEMGEIAQGFDGVAEVEAFARRHIDLTRRYWAAEGRCLNWFVTGPARFPVARNEKRLKIADARRADITAHAVAARKAAKRKAFPHGADSEPIRSGDPAAVEKIKAKIEALALSIDKAKAANAIIRRMEKDGAGDDAMITAIMAQTGLPAEVAARGVVLAEWQVRRGFDTSGSRAEIRRLHARLKALEKMQERGTESRTVEAEAIGAVEIKENADIARIQMIFPGKPDEHTRRLLKANGFRWSPSQGAWQRHLNEAGRWAAERVMKAISAGEAA